MIIMTSGMNYSSLGKKISSALCAIYILFSLPAHGETLVFGDLTVSVNSLCEEGNVTCEDIEFTLNSYGSEIHSKYVGSTVHTKCADGVSPCAFQGYQFTVNGASYMLDKSGLLQVTNEQNEVLLSESESNSVNSEKCLPIDSNDGVPTEFHRQKCFADRALMGRRYLVAAEHYKKASTQYFFEAPNYDIRLDLGRALCLAGKFSEGRSEISSFLLMAKSDLGVSGIDCLDENVQERFNEEHVHLACEGYGSSLSESGRNELIKRVKLADQFMSSCN